MNNRTTEDHKYSDCVTISDIKIDVKDILKKN